MRSVPVRNVYFHGHFSERLNLVLSHYVSLLGGTKNTSFQTERLVVTEISETSWLLADVICTLLEAASSECAWHPYSQSIR